MGIRRSNKAVSHATAERYRSSHWGIEGKTVYEIDDPRLPAELVQMGELLEIEIETSKGNLGIEFPDGCHLAFSIDEAERLYVLCPPATMKWAAQKLWRSSDWPSITTLQAAAEHAGGRQAEYPYPDVEVQQLGGVVHVVYRTAKKGDGLSEYIHEFGDEEEATGETPTLCVSADGMIWFAGGAYHCPDAGITG